MPSLKTSVTFRIAETSLARSPSSTTRSATFPAAMVPSSSDTPRIFAPLAEQICTASSAEKPASTSSSRLR